MILSRLGNIVDINDRKKIKKELYEIEKKENLSDNEKEEIYGYLVQLVKTLDKKEKYKYHDRDDLDYLLWNKRQKIYFVMLFMMIITNQY